MLQLVCLLTNFVCFIQPLNYFWLELFHVCSSSPFRFQFQCCLQTFRCDDSTAFALETATLPHFGRNVFAKLNHADFAIKAKFPNPNFADAYRNNCTFEMLIEFKFKEIWRTLGKFQNLSQNSYRVGNFEFNKFAGSTKIFLIRQPIYANAPREKAVSILLISFQHAGGFIGESPSFPIAANISPSSLPLRQK